MKEVEKNEEWKSARMLAYNIAVMIAERTRKRIELVASFAELNLEEFECDDDDAGDVGIDDEEESFFKLNSIDYSGS